MTAVRYFVNAVWCALQRAPILLLSQLCVVDRVVAVQPQAAVAAVTTTLVPPTVAPVIHSPCDPPIRVPFAASRWVRNWLQPQVVRVSNKNPRESILWLSLTSLTSLDADFYHMKQRPGLFSSGPVS